MRWDSEWLVSWLEIYCLPYLGLEPTICLKVCARSWVHRWVLPLLQDQGDRNHEGPQRSRDRAAAKLEMRAPAGVRETWWGRQFSDLVQASSPVSHSGRNWSPHSWAPASCRKLAIRSTWPRQCTQSSSAAEAPCKWALSWAGVREHIKTTNKNRLQRRMLRRSLSLLNKHFVSELTLPCL